MNLTKWKFFLFKTNLQESLLLNESKYYSDAKTIIRGIYQKLISQINSKNIDPKDKVKNDTLKLSVTKILNGTTEIVYKKTDPERTQLLEKYQLDFITIKFSNQLSKNEISGLFSGTTKTITIIISSKDISVNNFSQYMSLMHKKISTSLMHELVHAKQWQNKQTLDQKNKFQNWSSAELKSDEIFENIFKNACLNPKFNKNKDLFEQVLFSDFMEDIRKEISVYIKLYLTPHEVEAYSRQLFKYVNKTYEPNNREQEIKKILNRLKRSNVFKQLDEYTQELFGDDSGDDQTIIAIKNCISIFFDAMIEYRIVKINDYINNHLRNTKRGINNNNQDNRYNRFANLELD